MTPHFSVKSQAGWQASIHLRFQYTPEQTLLISRRHKGPLLVQYPFYPEGNTCHVYLLHPPGGVVGGDSLDIQVSLLPKSRALITMPGATKFYRSAGETAYLTQQFHLKAGSVLEWLPQDTILFDQSRVNIKTIFHIEQESTLIAWDVMCFGRPVLQEKFLQGQCRNRLEVWQNNTPLFIEHLDLSQGELNLLAEQAYVATMLFYPADESLLFLLREKLLNASPFLGMTLVESLLVVRLLSSDNLECQRVLYQLWQWARETLTGLEPQLPRIWST